MYEILQLQFDIYFFLIAELIAGWYYLLERCILWHNSVAAYEFLEPQSNIQYFFSI